MLFDLAQQLDRDYGIDLQARGKQRPVARSLEHVGDEPRALRRDEEVSGAANASPLIELDPSVTLRNDIDRQRRHDFVVGTRRAVEPVVGEARPGRLVGPLGHRTARDDVDEFVQHEHTLLTRRCPPDRRGVPADPGPERRDRPMGDLS